RQVETDGGKHCVLFFLPARDEEYLVRFFRSFGEAVESKPLPDVGRIFILGDTVSNLIALKSRLEVPHLLCADAEHKFARAVGVFKPLNQSVHPTAYVLGRNLKIATRFDALAPEELARAAVSECDRLLQEDLRRSEPLNVFTETGPAVIVPGTFTPEFCARCIEAFRQGRTFDGTVGGKKAHTYQPDIKVRTDFIVQGELLAEIDEKLSRSFFPELKKVFGFEVTHREVYKIGLYSGDKGGFFRPHRDNFDAPMGYRRMAMTLHLSEDYDGGGLR